MQRKTDLIILPHPNLVSCRVLHTLFVSLLAAPGSFRSCQSFLTSRCPFSNLLLNRPAEDTPHFTHIHSHTRRAASIGSS